MTSAQILLVEDNEDDVELTISAFRENHLGNEITVVRDGAEALDYLFRTGSYANRRTPDPELILLDLNLPKVGGLEVLERLRADDRTRIIPVVILTSSKDEDDIVAGFSRGANSYVRKPVDYDEFVKAVNDLGAYWLVLNQSPVRAAAHV